jgi:non-specific serine/threonine protein kinase
VFEFITGRPLFCIDTFDCDQDGTNDDHFLQFFDIIGPIPRSILSKWTRSDVYFNVDGENIKSYIGELPEGFDLNELQHLPPLEEFFDQEKPVGMSDEESRQIKHILRWILQYDKTKRPTASELLNDPWFVEHTLIIHEGRCCGE